MSKETVKVEVDVGSCGVCPKRKHGESFCGISNEDISAFYWQESISPSCPFRPDNKKEETKPTKIIWKQSNQSIHGLASYDGYVADSSKKMFTISWEDWSSGQNSTRCWCLYCWLEDSGPRRFNCGDSLNLAKNKAYGVIERMKS